MPFMAPPKLKREIPRYLLVGGMAVAIDAGGYALFVHTGLLTPSWAKRVSFVMGSVWAFFMNKYYTFEQKELRLGEPFLFAAVYAAGWLFNSVSHDLVLAWTGIKTIAFLIATGISTCTNFIGQKWIVFRSRREPA